MKCEPCQLQMLPYLYELLEEQDRAEMAEHLANCPACLDALRIAKEQQSMLAEAVREHRSEIVFAAPTHGTAVKAATQAPTLLLPKPASHSDEPNRPKRRSLFLINRWSIAAAILLLVFSAGGVICGVAWNEQSSTFAQTQNRLAQAQQDLAKTQDAINKKKSDNQKEIRAIQEQIDKLFQDWKKAETTTRKVLDEKRVSLTIIGPQNAIAGATNNYQVQLANKAQTLNSKKKGNDLAGSPPQLQVRAVDQKSQKVLYEQNVRLQGNEGQGNFDLPPNLPIMPGQQIELQFQAQTDDGKPVFLRDNLNLVFPEYVTHLTTDRPMYRPGETVRFRSLTLERFSLKPVQQPFQLRYRILGPRGDEIYKSDMTSQVVLGDNKEPLKGPKNESLFGLGAGEFPLPAQLPGGHYSLIVSEINERFHEEKRDFLVHHWQAPRFSKDVQFHRSSYGAGDQVKLTVRVAPIQGLVAGMNIKSNISVIVEPSVDGFALPQLNRQTDNDGRADFEFHLPPQILKGEGRVTIKCSDGGSQETIQRTIPITGRDLQVEFFPEGGDLIVGVPNRVYFQVRTLANRPADLEGRVVDERGIEVARIRTNTDDREPGVNQGLGSFTFTPQPKRRYSLRVDSPIGIERIIALPSVKDRGVVLHIAQGVVQDEINVVLTSVKDRRDLLVGAYCRGRLLAHQSITIDANQQETVTLKPTVNVGGVYRITVFEKLRVGGDMQFRPLAERLIYRKSSERVEVAVESDRASYQPGDSVQLKLRARNEKMESVPAIALVAVVDNGALKLADDKKARSMPTHFFLTTELRNPGDLESADILLGDHPKAAMALDLLLGSQGWRRFAEQDPQLFQRRQQQAKQPLFLANSVQIPQFLDSEQKQIEQLDQKFVTPALDLQKKLAERERSEVGPQQLRDEVNVKLTNVESIRQEIASAERSLRRSRAFLWQFVFGGVLLTLFFIGFYLLSVGLRRLSEGENPALWFVLGFGLFAFLFFASIIGTFALMGENFMEFDDFRFGRNAVKAVAPAPILVDANVMNAQPELPILNLPEADRTDVDPPNGFNDNQDANPDVGGPQKGRNVANRDDVLIGQNVAVNPNWLDFANGRFDPQDERRLRQQGQYQTILLKHLGRRVQLPAAADPSIVREFAHLRKPKKDDVRRDFTETVYWHPVLVMPDGQAQVQFDLSDAVTSYQVLVLSHTAEGRLGSSQAKIVARLPFSVEPTVPIEVTNSDQITIPVAVNNDTTKPTSVTLAARAKGLEIVEKLADRGLNLEGNQRKREFFSVKPTIVQGTANMRVVAKTTGFGDSIERSFKVVQDGFPIHGSVSGILDNRFEHEITLPAQWLPGSLTLQAQCYPSPLAELQNGLDALLREPNGCFEQSSSSNYPNVMILNLMKQNHQANPPLEKHARLLMHAGYQKLTSFECVDPKQPGTKRGYEWFGQTPPHEALTAYGLMQFRDMAGVYPVEPEMLRRTEKYLLDQRDGKGGFRRNPASIDQFGRAPSSVTDAYLVWALTESGVKDNLNIELTTLRERAKISKDTYFLALTALSHLNRKKIDDGLTMLRTLRDQQKASGEVPGAQTSITGSQGRDLLIETTSLAVLGWLKANRPAEFQPNIHNGVKWLGQQRRDGAFGGTQATILALKAIVAYDQKNPRLMQGGNVALLVRDTLPGIPNQQIINRAPQFDGAMAPPGMLAATPDGSTASFSARSQDVITLKIRDANVLRPGKNLIELNVTGANQIPFSLTWSYRTIQPANDPKAPVKLTTKLGKVEAKEGEAVKLNAVIENASGKGQGMTVAIVGLPAGLALPDDFEQLKSLTGAQGKANVLSAWELRGRELVLYWRDLAPDAKISLDLDLICRIPGNYRGPASRAYLYYDADRKYWVEPLSMRIFEGE